MDTLSALADGFGALLAPTALIALLAGVVIGSVVGVLPGIGPVGAMALLLPLSFAFDPAVGLLMTIAIYLGSQYGGSTSSILLSVPGEASSVVTTLDGHQMTKRGRAGAALAVSAIGSFVAGTMAVALLMLLSEPLSAFAIRFSAPEYLALCIFAILVLSRLSGGTFTRSMLAVGLGLMLATIGLDDLSGNVRFTFDIGELIQGVEITPVAVGLFGIAEVLLLAENRGHVPQLPKVPFRSLWPTRTEMRRAVPPMFRGGLLGFFFGLVPGPSAAVSTYASYMLERRISKHRDEFGKGAIEGVSGPESANNGAAGGAMVPLIVLGFPFNGVTALLLAGFTIHGIIPGPLFVENSPDLFWSLVAGMYAANITLLILNFPLVGLFTSLLRIPRDVLLGLIVLIAIIGTYAARSALIDVFWLFAMGVLGYVMVKLRLSRVALMLAFVIGPILESSLTQTVAFANGDPTVLLQRPITMTIVVLTALVVLTPVIFRGLKRDRAVDSADAV
ncbi:tripartite tricarboxylate transporter permease [Ruania alkalisoli]|uniref:Tripartite tricarboxylate transporter permease n=1 Tax=Ruania alkalisoli TaxID=2779775 RepID=A0A7M1SU90_9MICO|nr:tripartite tricarboxylate transporter permease [Ruania alkalisoli]QOR71095.1 tripartite tricarboxylate transporter permease [Ruania alkalisoli]